jgi:SAM-dependent methyltransferase
MNILGYLYRLLGKARVYDFFQKMVTPEKGYQCFIKEHLAPFKGCRVVDFGCGSAVILHDLIPYEVDYIGVDYNMNYIIHAREQFRDYPQANFLYTSVDGAFHLEKAGFDLALSVGVLHHLTDKEAEVLVYRAWQALKPGGVLVTMDGAYVESQHPVGRFLLKLDRGKYVRTPQNYDKIIGQYFRRTEARVIHNRLRIPYTHYITRCYKD